MKRSENPWQTSLFLGLRERTGFFSWRFILECHEINTVYDQIIILWPALNFTFHANRAINLFNDMRRAIRAASKFRYTSDYTVCAEFCINIEWLYFHFQYIYFITGNLLSVKHTTLDVSFLHIHASHPCVILNLHVHFFFMNMIFITLICWSR